jgi:RNA polymerase sigma-70 factor (ECF subfamily)
MSDLEQYRSYLILLARMRLGEGPLEPSDVVQQTLLEAHTKRQQFRGSTSEELAGWLRRLLFCTIADAWRTQHRDKRDIARLVSFEDSSAKLERWLADPGSSPSQRADHQDRLVRLAEAMSALPEDQRNALLQRYFDGSSIADIAQKMNRSVTAVAGLLKRGLQQLRTSLKEPS